MHRSIGFGFSLFLIATSASAQSVPASSTTLPPEKKICRRIIPTGTMFRKRFCLTAREWKEFAAINASSADRALSGRAVHGRLSVGDE